MLCVRVERIVFSDIVNVVIHSLDYKLILRVHVESQFTVGLFVPRLHLCINA